MGKTEDEGYARVLDSDRVYELSEAEGAVYAATETGLYVTPDAGDSWRKLHVPEAEVWSVHVADDDRLYAGSYPAGLFVSVDHSQWEEVEDIQSVPERERWYCPGDVDNGRIRTIRTVPERPDRLLVGVEVGGLYISADRGTSWTEHRHPVDDDIHHINVRGPDEYLVCCGKRNLEEEYISGGLFRTTDGGDSWVRLDLGDHSYVRESIVHEETLYISGAKRTPGDWDGEGGAEATLFESRDEGATFERVAYPGEPQELVLSWAIDDDRIYGGTGTRAYDEGRIVRRDDGGWTDVGRLPTNVYSLASV